MAPRVSIVSTCMGRLAHLRETLPTWASQPGAEVVVVDWSCPDGAADWVGRTFPDAKAVRVPGQAVFHLTAARNAGAAAATGDWLAFVDADVALAPDFGSQVFPRLGEPAFWLAEGGPKELAGTMLVPRAAFEAAGGYDEAIVGWGSEDVDLYRRLAARGLAKLRFPGALLACIPHGDDLRVAHAEIKEKDLGWLVNLFYLEAKQALMARQGADLDLATRRSLYAEARRAVLAAVPSGQDAVLELSTGWRTLSGPAQVEERLVFTLRLPR
jgi:hypothetical protein